MTDTSLLSFEVDVLNTDVADDVSCDGLASLVIDSGSDISDILILEVGPVPSA